MTHPSTRLPYRFFPLVLLLVGLLISPNMSIAEPVCLTQTIAENVTQFTKLDIAKGYVAWLNSEWDAQGIYLYDIEAKTREYFANDTGINTYFSLDDGMLVWNQLVSPGNADIYLHNTHTNITTSIGTSPLWETSPYTDGQTVVWSKIIYDSFLPPARIDIMKYDIASGDLTTLTGDDTHAVLPVVDGDKIAWAGNMNATWIPPLTRDAPSAPDYIFLHDVATGDTSQLTFPRTDGGYRSDGGIRIAGNHLIWGSDTYTEMILSKTHYDIASGERYTLDEGKYWFFGNALAGDIYVYWRASQDPYPDASLIVYDLINQTEKTIAIQQYLGGNLSADTDGRYIVWASEGSISQKHPQNSDYDIHLYDSTTELTNQITVNDLQDREPHVDNGMVAWQQEDKIMLYRCGESPTITDGPYDTPVLSGESATLSVNASGAVPLHYQWYAGVSGDVSTPVGDDSATYTTPALITDAEYWVRVHNEFGQRDSTTATVTVMEGDVPGSFMLVSPQYDTLLRDTVELASFNWTVAPEAETYDFYLTMISTNVRIGTVTPTPLLGLTPANDTDPLTCDDTLCTLLLSVDLRGALIDGTYSWDVFANNFFGSVEAENGMHLLRVSSIPVNLLTNTSFEVDSDGDKIPDAWIVMDANSADKMVCYKKDKPNKVVAKEGLCAFRFKGLPHKRTKLKQKLDIDNLVNGDTLTLNLWMKGQHVVTGGKALLKVKYTDGRTDKQVIRPPTGVFDYQHIFADPLTIDGSLNKAKVILLYRGASGKLYFDAIDLMPAASGLLPLPRAR